MIWLNSYFSLSYVTQMFEIYFTVVFQVLVLKKKGTHLMGCRRNMNSAISFYFWNDYKSLIWSYIENAEIPELRNMPAAQPRVLSLR
jgi:hypothetical protein